MAATPKEPASQSSPEPTSSESTDDQHLEDGEQLPRAGTGLMNPIGKPLTPSPDLVNKPLTPSGPIVKPLTPSPERLRKPLTPSPE